jgi:hypothetical protein
MLQLISYEISQSIKLPFTPGVLETKKGITVLQLNFHWPSALKVEIEVDAFLAIKWQPDKLLPWLESQCLISTCVDVSWITETRLIAIFEIDKRKDTQAKLGHYSIHNLVLGEEKFPLRIVSKRSKPSLKRRVDDAPDSESKKNAIDSHEKESEAITTTISTEKNEEIDDLTTEEILKWLS